MKRLLFVFALFLACIVPAQAQLIYGNTFPYWNVNGPFTATIGPHSMTGGVTVDTLTASASVVTPTLSVTSGWTGVANSSVASAGSVGQWIQGTTPQISAIVASSGTGQGVACTALTAGDWNVQGLVEYSSVAGTFTRIVAGISPFATSAVAQTDGTYSIYLPNATAVTGLSAVSVTTPLVPLQLNSTSTYCVNGTATFGGTSAAVYGILNARRVK